MPSSATAQRPTRPAKLAAPLLGSEQPRLWTPPLRRLTPKTSAGFQAIEFAEQILGWTPLPWQRWLLIHALELLPDGRPRFRTVLVLVARQNGKTALLVVLALFWLFVQRRQLVLGTSTNLDYARESWEKAVALVEEIDDLSDLVPQPSGIRRTNGEQTFTTADRCRYKIATASRRGGRSLTVSNLILDELREHHDWSSWAAATKAMNAVADAQVWALSNAGDDRSIVLNDLQATGRVGSNERLGLFEWSAPDGTRCTCSGKPHTADCRLQDRRLWAMANPSLGHTIDPDVIAGDLKTDDVSVFLTEDLCLRVSSLEPPPIDADIWSALARPVPQASLGPPVFFIDAAPGLRSASIAVAAKRGTVPNVELADARPTAEWVAARCAELKHAHRGARFVLSAADPASALTPDLAAAGVQVDTLTAREMGQACVALEKAVAGREFTHSGDERFTTALDGAASADIGDGLWKWVRSKSSTDITSLVAATGALWALAVKPSYDPLDSIW